MKRWTKLSIGAAAVVLAIAAGTAAFAMRGGDDASSQKRAADDAGGAFGICIEGATDCVDVVVSPDQSGDEGIAEGEPPPSAGMCAPGVTDCVDTVVDPAGGTCLEGTTDCVDTVMDPPACPEGMTMEECFPEGPPAGYDCVALESFPVQVKCTPIGDDGDPCSPEPDANVRCLPPDCAVSSDGSITCPDDANTDPPAGGAEGGTDGGPASEPTASTGE